MKKRTTAGCRAGRWRTRRHHLESYAAAAKYKLDNLVAIVDINNLQLDGTIAEVMPTEPIDAKFRAFGFDVLTMNGHDG